MIAPRITRLNTVRAVVYFVSACAFVSSFEKIYGVAEYYGAGWVAFALPLAIDGSLIGATVALDSSSGRVKGWAWSLVFAGTVASVYCNVRHVQLSHPGDVAGWFVAATPTLLLFGLTHLLVAMSHPLRVTDVAPETTDTVAPEDRNVAPVDPADVAPVTLQHSQVTATLHPDVAPESGTDVAPRKLHAVRDVAGDVAPDVAPKPRGTRFTDEQIAQTLANVAAGMSQREAGRLIGTSGTTVARWLREA